MANNGNGAYKLNSTVTFGSFLRNYFIPEYKTMVNERTFENRITTLNKHLLYFETYMLKDIDIVLVQEWKNKISGQKYKKII